MRIDPGRGERTGVPEIVYGPGKTPSQCAAAVMALLRGSGGAVLASRVDEAQADAILSRCPEARWEPHAGVVVAREAVAAPATGVVAITSDLDVDARILEECRSVLRALRVTVTSMPSGVAGSDVLVHLLPLWRIPTDACLRDLRGPLILVPATCSGWADPLAIVRFVRLHGRAVPGATFVNVDGGVPAALTAIRFLRARDRRHTGV